MGGCCNLVTLSTVCYWCIDNYCITLLILVGPMEIGQSKHHVNGHLYLLANNIYWFPITSSIESGQINEYIFFFIHLSRFSSQFPSKSWKAAGKEWNLHQNKVFQAEFLRIVQTKTCVLKHKHDPGFSSGPREAFDRTSEDGQAKTLLAIHTRFH